MVDPTSGGAPPSSELEQLRRIDRAARAFVDAMPALGKQKCLAQYDALLRALYDGSPDNGN